MATRNENPVNLYSWSLLRLRPWIPIHHFVCVIFYRQSWPWMSLGAIENSSLWWWLIMIWWWRWLMTIWWWWFKLVSLGDEKEKKWWWLWIDDFLGDEKEMKWWRIWWWWFKLVSLGDERRGNGGCRVELKAKSAN